METYFQKTFRPDIVNGNVATVIQSNKTDLPFGSNDLLFDWHALDIPRGVDGIVDLHAHSYGEDGGTQPGGDFHLLFAKSNNGVAPTSLGTVNAVPSTCFELPDILMARVKVEGTTHGQGVIRVGGHLGNLWDFNRGGGNSRIGPIAIEPEQNSFGGTDTNRIYVAGLCGAQAFDFSTGVLLNDGSDVADDAGTSLTVDGVDPRKAFRAGDTLYIHDVDTPIGTIATLAENTITLTSNNVGAIANNDEFMNAKPMTFTVGFRRR